MFDFKYCMPTKILYGKNIIKNNDNIFSSLGKKAFIITGKNSSKINGSLNDVLDALNANNIEYIMFDDVEENPSVETVNKAASLGKSEMVDFIIGIGGGSPIDAAKAISVLISNPEIDGFEIFDKSNLSSIPVLAVPTTAGTGTEVTQYAILTDKLKGTKRNFNQTVFPKYALIDPRYLMNTPKNVTINTAIDALSHLIEGYLSTDSNIISDMFAEKGFDLFSDCIEPLKNNDFPYEIREKLILASTFAGIVIAQAGTSLPHGMGYALTYYHGIPHGKANGLLLKSYLELSNSNHKVKTLLSLLDFSTIDDFGQFIKQIIANNCCISENELRKYTKEMIQNPGKLKKHSGDVTEKDIYEMYITSFTL